MVQSSCLVQNISFIDGQSKVATKYDDRAQMIEKQRHCCNYQEFVTKVVKDQLQYPYINGEIPLRKKNATEKMENGKSFLTKTTKTTLHVAQ